MKNNQNNIPSNHHHNQPAVQTIGDVHDVFAGTFGRIYAREGNFGKALSLACKDTRNAVKEMIAVQASDPDHGFHAMSSFRQKWATLLGKESMTFTQPEKGRGLQFETEAETVKRLFTVLLESKHHTQWREFFTDVVATCFFNDGKFLSAIQKHGKEHDEKIVALKPVTKPAAEQSVGELEEALATA